jgi:ABC-2 type transport system permease protein
VVAHLVRLKLTLLRNSLRRSVAAVVGMAFGVLYGGTLLVTAVAALVALRLGHDLALTRTAVVLGGAGLLLGWALVPVLAFGTDPTLDPARFATFAVPERRLAVGLLLTGLVGLPGLATAVLLLAAVVAVSRSPGAVLVGLVAAALGALTCVLLSRIVTAAASAVLASRRGRDLAGVAGLLLVLAIGPLVSALGSPHRSTAGLRRLADMVAWTPLGWPWTAMGEAAAGRWSRALTGLALAAALVALLVVVWERLLVSVLRNPRPQSGGDSGRKTGLGLFGRLPGTPTGAIAARAGTYWLRDPRLNFPGLVTALLPAALLIPGLASGSHLALAAMPLASGYLIGWGQHNDVGYDSTAFWLHVASGVDGVSDRLGRLFPSAVLALVCVPGYAVLGPLVGLPWRLLPATLGVAVGVVLNGFAVACVTSAVKQYAVPAPGENPFTNRPGSVGVTLAVQSLCGSAVVGLSLPAVVLGVLAWLGHQWAAWTALVVGPTLGAVAMVVGVRLGAGLFRERQALLLQDLVAMR